MWATCLHPTDEDLSVGSPGSGHVAPCLAWTWTTLRRFRGLTRGLWAFVRSQVPKGEGPGAPRFLCGDMGHPLASQRVSGRTMAPRLGSVVSHPKARLVAARFRVGTSLLPNLVLSEVRT